MLLIKFMFNGSLFNFLLKFVIILGIKKINDCNVQTVAYLFQGNYSRIFAFSVKYSILFTVD